MRKVLVSIVAASALASSLSAIEVYKEGNNFVDIYGDARAIAGYGHTMTFGKVGGVSSDATINSNILFGVQGNSRLGVKFRYNNFIGDVQLGANEQTLYNSGANNMGFRYLYAGYDFGDAGVFVVGKMDTPMVNNFSSSVFDTDGGMNGFGGYATGARRIQVQYKLPIGLTLAIIENDVANNMYSVATKNEQTNFTTIPRVALSYEYKSKGTRARIAATYARAESFNTTRAKDAAAVNLGIKQDISETFYVSGLLSYGFNGHLTGEQSIANPNVGNGIGSAMNAGSASYADMGATSHIYAGFIELGGKLTEDFGIAVSGGYQLAAFKGDNHHSYGAFIQLPYKFNNNFSIVPHIGYYGVSTYTNSDNNTNIGGIFAMAQLKVNF